LTQCTTGQAANDSIDCRMAGAADSLDTYWAGQFDTGYRSTQIVLFTDQTDTGCGGATSAVGPFYCPNDETIYLDTSFYDDLTTRFGASGGSLAQMYVVAHEWGHHIQNLVGTMSGLDLQDTGPTSDGVRLEVQADCFAGAWVGAASTIVDENGTPFLEPVTDQQIADALSAASAVGDDRIQQATQGQVTPETWTHGSSEMRQRWFTTGFQGGPNACDTFSAASL
jgi:predicted metalloprotease